MMTITNLYSLLKVSKLLKHMYDVKWIGEKNNLEINSMKFVIKMGWVIIALVALDIIIISIIS